MAFRPRVAAWSGRLAKVAALARVLAEAAAAMHAYASQAGVSNFAVCESFACGVGSGEVTFPGRKS